jgi:hypothetical protein
MRMSTSERVPNPDSLTGRYVVIVIDTHTILNDYEVVKGDNFTLDISSLTGKHLRMGGDEATGLYLAPDLAVREPSDG